MMCDHCTHGLLSKHRKKCVVEITCRSQAHYQLQMETTSYFT